MSTFRYTIPSSHRNSRSSYHSILSNRSSISNKNDDSIENYKSYCINWIIIIVRKQLTYYNRLLQEYSINSLKGICNAERADKQLNSLSYVYMEIDYQTICNLFEYVLYYWNIVKKEM